jgi:hypothetical protein
MWESQVGGFCFRWETARFVPVLSKSNYAGCGSHPEKWIETYLGAIRSPKRGLSRYDRFSRPMFCVQLQELSHVKLLRLALFVLPLPPHVEERSSPSL